MDCCSLCANSPVLARPENIPRIRKQPDHLNCAGVLAYLAIREAKLSFARIDGPIGEDQLEFQQLHRRVQSSELEIFLVAYGEIDFDRINRGDGSNGVRRLVDEITDLNLRNTGDAINRRHQPCEAEI